VLTGGGNLRTKDYQIYEVSSAGYPSVARWVTLQ
jgi:hypothetical protein